MCAKCFWYGSSHRGADLIGSCVKIRCLSSLPSSSQMPRHLICDCMGGVDECFLDVHN